MNAPLWERIAMEGGFLAAIVVVVFTDLAFEVAVAYICFAFWRVQVHHAKSTNTN